MREIRSTRASISSSRAIARCAITPRRSRITPSSRSPGTAPTSSSRQRVAAHDSTTADSSRRCARKRGAPRGRAARGGAISGRAVWQRDRRVLPLRSPPPPRLIAFGVVVLIPLLVFGLGIRTAMSRRVAAEYESRVTSLVGVIRADLVHEQDRITGRLRAVKDRMVADNRLRSAVLRGDDRGYILDYAGDAMRLAGIDFLPIQNGDRRVVSSGHFRNEFDRFGAFATPGGVTLIRAATAEGPFLGLLHAH